MTKNVDISSALNAVTELLKNEVPENEVPGTAVPENDVNSGSCTAVAQNEPEWYHDGDAWVKLFLEPIAPGKFKQFDYIYDVPGENEFPKERWSSEEYRDGFHITLRRDVWYHLILHGYESAYIAEVVSTGEELYDNLIDKKRKVRVVTFGPVVPLAEVLGKHPDDFKNGQMLAWSAANNHLEMVKLTVSKNSDGYAYSWAFEIALENENEQIAEFLFENCENNADRQEMFCNAIACGRADMVKRMMENTSVDVGFFKLASVNGQFEIFQLLRAKYGEPKCSDIITPALRGGNVDILNYIKSRGVDMSDLGMFVYACTHAYNTDMLKYLVSEGADVKHPLVAYIAKRHAYDEVREYLVAEIDDKSNVLDVKVYEEQRTILLRAFQDRLNAGEFEGR
jgi:hypothetical protein